MTASERLHDKVLDYAQAEIRSILMGAANPQFHYDQLLGMLNGYVHCQVITQAEADIILSDAQMALDNSLPNLQESARLSGVTAADKPDKT
jgi:hypothetical protein